ncbi:hypothetical protein [Zhenpiania hominis]|uniref:hypothetical protein n=1 Tax=Zhenpiania hominis TaxID=2763644 RepID=UPI0039F5BC60
MLQMFERSLAERYARLYGKKNFQKKVEKERRKLLFTGAAILAFLCAALLFGFAEGEESYEYMRFNQKGELIEIKRPSAEQGAISFSARVQMGAGASARTKEIFITIDPLGSAEEVDQDGILPEKTEEEKEEDELNQLIAGFNSDTTNSKITMPKELKNGENLVWKKSEDSSLMLYFTLAVVMLWMLYKGRFYTVEKEEKRARESIIRELPQFINKMILLISAGVVLHTAFLKIVDDYEKSGKHGSYFYMQLTQIGRAVRETNGSLCQELQQFAKRSGVKELIRISNILSDNLSKGADLSEKLKQENSLLWLARKQQSEEKGRLAETKLTLPLMILLLVLIMMTIAPAMMEI